MTPYSYSPEFSSAYHALRSAISSVQEKVDGSEVGQHPWVIRLITGLSTKAHPTQSCSVTGLTPPPCVGYVSTLPQDPVTLCCGRPTIGPA